MPSDPADTEVRLLGSRTQKSFRYALAGTVITWFLISGGGQNAQKLREQADMPVKFHRLHFKARNPEETAAWYERAFGFTITEKSKRQTGDL